MAGMAGVGDDGHGRGRGWRALSGVGDAEGDRYRSGQYRHPESIHRLLRQQPYINLYRNVYGRMVWTIVSIVGRVTPALENTMPIFQAISTVTNKSP